MKNNTQNEIYDLLQKEQLTVRQIAQRRGCSRQAVHKIVKKLIKTKRCDINLHVVDKGVSTTRWGCGENSRYRLHGQEFNILILKRSEGYEKLRKKSNIIQIDGNTIRLFENAIEVYIKKSFFGNDLNKIEADSIEYFNDLIPRLEHDLKAILIKNRYQNMRLVNSHYSELNNELAKDCLNRNDKISVRTDDDGKVFFKIDNSFNLHEAETIHPETSKEDMVKIGAFFNDIRKNETLTLSEISKYMVIMSKGLADTTYQINELSHGLKIIVELIKPKQYDDEIAPNEPPDYIQ